MNEHIALAKLAMNAAAEVATKSAFNYQKRKSSDSGVDAVS